MTVAEVAEARQLVLCRGLTNKVKHAAPEACHLCCEQEQRPEADIKKEMVC